jgi:branched-chain amino acid aminotransferase
MSTPTPARTEAQPLGTAMGCTAHMYTQTWTKDLGWHDAGIRPFAPFEVPPNAPVFANAQEIFEGMKAYRRPDGGVNLFRPYENAQRYNRSARRMCMPEVDPESFVKSIADLVRLDQTELSMEPNQVLYIRPAMIATAGQMGVFPGSEYLHFVILMQAPNHAAGMKLGAALISPEQVRAAHGGTGEAKTGGNYAASAAMGREAARLGYTHVLFLDSVHKKFVEEGAGMNVAFVYTNGPRPRIVTPALTGAILHGITRKSILHFAPDIGYDVAEAELDVHDVLRDIERGAITEVFGHGTGAVIAPLGRLGFHGKDYAVGNGIGPVTQHVYKTLTDLQHGRAADPYGWTFPL